MSLTRRPIRRIISSAKAGSVKSCSQQNIYTQLEQNPINSQQPQFINEEREDNAIFKIYLKRTRLASSSTIHTIIDDENEQNNDCGKLLYSEVKIYQLKAGTLEKIVECITNKDGDLDTTHMHILFATYRIYTNTRILIETLLARYREVIPASLDMTEDVRVKTLKSLSTAMIFLITAYKEDFYEPPCYTLLYYLMKNINDREIEKHCRKLLNGFENEDVDDNNNNNSTNRHTNDSLDNQRAFDFNTPTNFLDMSYGMIAEQLTIVDAELLQRVLPHECLSMKSNSNSRQNSNRTLSTVDKTIEQFSAVVNQVTATILADQTDLIRARIIEKWIDVANQCRQLKNFSSLTAILNGLLSGCIYRLNTAWSHVTQNHRHLLNELKNIFVSCADRKQARAILDKEGTVKCLDVTHGKKLQQKKSHDKQKSTMIGTVPYLGLYLSDLTYINSAHVNYINIDKTDKLINFEKHRKQFEILAQIKLFQSAVNANSTLKSLPYFKHWFDNVRINTEKENWDLSCQIEPQKVISNTDNEPQKLQEDLSPISRSQPLKAFPSQVSLESFVLVYNQNTEIIPGDSLRSTPSSTSLDKMSLTSIPSSPQRQQSRNINEKKKHSNHSRSSSASSFLTNASSSQGYMSAQGSPANSVANCAFTSVENNSLIAKVQLAGSKGLLYTKVRIGNNERVPGVLKTILGKFGLDPSISDRYCIEQQTPEKRILLLDHGNVFYALIPQPNDEPVQLTVREKTRQELEQKKIQCYPNTGHNRTPSGLSVSSTHSR